MEFYINKSIDRRWRQELHEKAVGVRVFSPYITSRTAESVLSSLDAGTCEIHTVFRAELFASGASSLTTLKKLVEQGHKLFHVPDLHAKIVLIPGRFASLGSQNLTRGGTRNKEASVVFDDEAVVRKIEKRFQPWVENRILITDQMIADMDELLPDVERLYGAARAAAQAADEELERCRREAEEREAKERARREAEIRKAALEAEERSRRLRYLSKEVHRAPTSQQTAYCRVDYSDAYFDRISLLPVNKANLNSWSVNGERITLARLTRYLCILEGNGRLGWARVAKSRISYVNDALQHNRSVTLGGRICYLRFEADWSSSPPYGRNLVIEVRNTFAVPLCRVSVWFTPEDMELLAIEQIPGLSAWHDSKTAMIQWIEGNWNAFRVGVLPRMAAPFKYTEKLAGDNVSEYFGGLGTTFALRVIQVDGEYSVLAARSRP